MQVMTPPTGEEIAAQQAPAPATAHPAAGAPQAAPVSQTVLFTANDDVWLRIYDEAGERLKDGLMKKGETFTLPANARNPMILTGRPQALTVTVGGKQIAPLGPPDRTIADVPVNAEALLARAAPTGGATTPAPAPSTRTGAGHAVPAASPTAPAAPAASASPGMAPAETAPAQTAPED
jgi:hypothetical protein